MVFYHRIAFFVITDCFRHSFSSIFETIYFSFSSAYCYLCTLRIHAFYVTKIFSFYETYRKYHYGQHIGPSGDGEGCEVFR